MFAVGMRDDGRVQLLFSFYAVKSLLECRSLDFDCEKLVDWWRMASEPYYSRSFHESHAPSCTWIASTSRQGRHPQVSRVDSLAAGGLE